MDDSLKSPPPKKRGRPSTNVSPVLNSPPVKTRKTTAQIPVKGVSANWAHMVGDGTIDILPQYMLPNNRMVMKRYHSIKINRKQSNSFSYS